MNRELSKLAVRFPMVRRLSVDMGKFWVVDVRLKLIDLR